MIKINENRSLQFQDLKVGDNFILNCSNPTELYTKMVECDIMVNNAKSSRNAIEFSTLTGEGRIVNISSKEQIKKVLPVNISIAVDTIN